MSYRESHWQLSSLGLGFRRAEEEKYAVSLLLVPLASLSVGVLTLGVLLARRVMVGGIMVDMSLEAVLLATPLAGVLALGVVALVVLAIGLQALGVLTWCLLSLDGLSDFEPIVAKVEPSHYSLYASRSYRGGD